MSILNNAYTKISIRTESGARMVFNFPVYFTAQAAQRKKAFTMILQSEGLNGATQLDSIIETYKGGTKQAWNEASLVYQREYKDPAMEYERGLQEYGKKKLALKQKRAAKERNDENMKAVKNARHEFEKMQKIEEEWKAIKEKARI